MKTMRTMRSVYDVAVIGGGAAGLLAAGRAAAGGLSVVLFEKMEKPARKVRITGKGRCNLTNDRPTEELLEKVRSGRDFVRPALTAFTARDTQAFFESLGVPLTVERGGRVFPRSGRAWDVADALERYARISGAELLNRAEALRLLTDGARIAGVEVSVDRRKTVFNCRKVLIATGGMSYPSTGSTGDGYRLAHACGHAVEPVRPSLVPLELRSRYQRVLNGLLLKNVALTLRVDGEERQREFGEMEFTPFGMGGAIVLKISRQAVDALIEEKRVEAEIDLKPALSPQQLLARMDRETAAEEHLTVERLVRKLLPGKLVAPVVREAGLKPYDPAGEMTSDQRERLARTLKRFSFRISGYRPFSEAVVTAGGIVLSEVDAATMRSKRIEGLYFAGEVLDIDADTGGYNLQLAFSTAWQAANGMLEEE